MARAQRAAYAALIAAAICLALAAPADAAVAPIKQPNWVELTPQQQQVLAPLAGEWDSLAAYRRKKWLGIAKRYSAMKPEEQQRVQTQMRQWVDLTPEERMAAREKFKRLRNAPPEQRASVKQKWLEYKDLPEDEKLRLQEAAKKNKAAPKSAGTKKSGVPIAASKRITASHTPAATPAGGSISGVAVAPAPAAPASALDPTQAAPANPAPAR